MHDMELSVSWRCSPFRFKRWVYGSPSMQNAVVLPLTEKNCFRGGILLSVSQIRYLLYKVGKCSTSMQNAVLLLVARGSVCGIFVGVSAL